jgi:hypothetical protein
VTWKKNNSLCFSLETDPFPYNFLMLIHLLQSRQEGENEFFGKESKINIEVQVPVIRQVSFINLFLKFDFVVIGHYNR